MVRFRSTCTRHRQRFIDTLTRARCTDSAEMDKLRRRLLA
jgi:hypothetical protein